MKGIVLAGGTGTRLWPLTISVSKQLLPIYDKPMIYYPISTLMSCGIREILLITTLSDQASFKNLLGDGSQFGIKLDYAIQSEPKGLAESFIIGEDFISENDVALILGDNLFSSVDFGPSLKIFQERKGAHIFVYTVSNPTAYGIVELNEIGDPVCIEEKPLQPKSHQAITGIYFFDKKVVEYAKGVRPSLRGELEIVDVLKTYMNRGHLHVTNLGSGSAWLDTGTPQSLHDASSYVRVMAERTGISIGNLHELAVKNQWVTRKLIEGENRGLKDREV
jgi:glucose-1-phosphate thymidylyltransferase